MHSESILIFIYRLINCEIKIWLHKDSLELFVPEHVHLTETQKNFIHQHRDKIFHVLQENCVYSRNYDTIVLKNITDKSGLSYAQERLWFIERYEGGSSAYNIPMVYRISGDADINLLSSSIQSILMRHDILRTVIREDEEGRGYQQVLDFSDEFYHLQKIKVTNRQDLQTAISQESNRAFDLENEYPIRVCFYELDDSPTGQNENYVSIVVHHIAFDGWSLDIFWKELHAYYNYYAQQKEGITEDLNLPELTIQYKDFALWQRNYLSGERLGTQLSYWLNKLAGYEPLALITDKTRPPEIDYTGQDIHFQLTQETSQALRTLAKDLKVSLYSLLLSAYYLMLRGYSYQNDLIVGTPAFNRHYAQIEHLIGFFVNSLAIRVKVDETFLITDFIKHVSEIVIDAQAHQDLPFEMLVEGLKVDQDTSRHPLFQVMFGLDASGGKNIESSIAPEDKTTPLLEQYVNAYDIHNIAKFDLSVFVDDQKDCLSGVFNYAVSLFNEQTIKGFVETYQTILGQFAELKSTNQNPQIQHLNYLPLNQYEKMIKDWNATDILYGSDQTIIDFFEEQVGKTPDAIAVIYEENQLTYMQLNQKANQLAHHLRQTYAISPDDPIALCLDRNEQMLIGILGILKAGGCYVPIGPNYPDERVKYILNDTNTKVVLVNEIHQKKLQNLLQKADVLVLDCPLMQMKLSDSPVTNPSPLALSSSLAYIIYTSGTTGNPKGVMIEHRGVVNRIQWMNQTYPLTEHDRILQKTPYVFDVSVWELLWAHWYGATIVFAKPEGHKDAAYIKEIISKERVTITHFVPSMLSVFEETLDHIGSDLHEDLANLRYIFCSGEALSLEQVTKCHHLLPWVSVHNLYGPTEASIDVLSYDCSDPEIKAVYIGKPIANTTAYVLNSSLQPVPIGGIGELHIGGMGLARGYLNQPELTAEKFIGNPFQSEEEKISGRNDRLYKTGDLVRWLSDGNIEYIGRNDFQVKIRGHRIELGEIESLLSTYEGIKQSVVVAKNHESTDGKGHLYLGGYYVSDHPLNEDEIRSYLHSQLPDYMVPTFLMWVASLPLTINGKLDRKALPTPELSHQETYIAPRSEEERKICSIWGEVLGLSSQVGIRDDFFRLGGDSIMSIQLTSRLRQRLGLTVSVRDIFKFRTIERLYDHILSTSLHKVDQIIIQSEQGLLEGEVPLLPVQQYFFANQFSALDHWNQSFLVETPSLSLHKLRESFAQLIAHHDNFKLRYQKVEAPLGAHYRQYYDPDAQPEELKLLDINSLGVPEDSPEFSEHLFSILTQWQSGFNLETGPLYCIGYLYGYQDGRARIYFALHHLIVDTVSWRILVEDLKDLYNAQPLGIKGSSYRQWVRAVQDYANSHETERNYWSSIMTDYDGHKLETLATSSSSFDVHAHQEELTLTKEKTKTLLQKSNQAYQTDINDLLLAALACTLKDLTGDCINHICMEGHGREEINPHLDITKTSGWFTTIYPVRLETRDDIGRTIRVMKETLRTLPNKGIGYGALVGYSEGLNELPKVSFNYLGQFDGQDHASSSWKIVDEISGQALSPLNKNRAIIDINGLIIDGVLHFSIASALDDQKTKDFTQCFQSHLEHVIDHTAHLGRTYLTISDVGHIIEQEYLDQLQKDQEIVGVYLANSLQQGFIYHALNQGEWDDAYKIQLIWTYHHKLNEEKLQQAWQYAQARYPALRLRFSWDPDLVQVVDKKGMPLDWSFIDISDIKDAAQQALKIKQIQQEDRKKAYDLEKGPLFRIILIKEQDQRYTCLLSYNHAILDGWSNPVLLDYVHETYLKLLDKKPVNTQTDTSYENAQLYKQEQKGLDQDYWSTYLSTIEDRTDLSGLLTASARNSQVRLSEYRHIQNSQEETLLIAEDLYQRIKELGQQEGVTTNAILQYAWHTVLSLCGHSQQTIVGTTVSGRDLPIDNIESSVGLYINTLPLIVNHQADQPIAMIDIIRSIQDNTNNISVRSNVNLASLQAKGERLFDSLFIYENYPDIVGGAASDQRLNITFEGGIEKLDYPLSVIVGEESGKILFTIKYAGELFDQERIKDIKDILHHLLSQLTQYPTQYHQHLNYLPLNQYEKMIKDWNATDILYGSDQTIIDFFEEQVGKTPDAIAVIYEENQLTYMQLNQKANQLAHHLRQTYAISPDDPIALCLDRNEQMLIGILGILKAGGCYVPIGPNYPDERVKYILNDTNTKVVLVNEIHQKKLQNLLQKADVLVLDCPLMQMKLSDSPVTNPSPLALSSSLAYIIYTSGTTGNPKGVMIEHRGVVNRIQWMNQTYPLTEHDRILQKTPYVFDVSVWELLWAHWYGATIVFAKPEGHKDAAYIKEIISKERVTITHFVPSMLSVFEETLDHIGSDLHEDLANLRYIFCSGEALSLEQVTKCHHLLPWVSVHNLYGPTEASIDVLSYDCSDPEIKAVYIGKPIANTTAYVLNSSLQPVPIGGIGELHIGGMGLARGYLNQPELTAEKFIGNPFQSEEEKISGRNDRLYKTGDLVRWLSDGNIEYIGRNDFQVKIRGHRIELGEIESLLSTYEGIKQSVVVAKNHESTDGKGHLYLGGYYVSDHPLNEDEIRSYLHSQLPDYMVPTFLMWVASLPLTINGKLDRKALPTPELSHQETYIAPRSEEERKICSIWGEVLGLSSQVGIRDDFFRLGGDSIMSIQLTSRLRQRLGLTVSVRDIFKFRTIERLYDHILSTSLHKVDQIIIQSEQGLLEGEVPLLPVQQYFFANQFSALDHWNQSFLVETPSLSLHKLRESFAQLIAHHDNFKLRYQKVEAPLGAHYRQYYDPDAQPEELKLLDINSLGVPEDSPEFSEHLFSILTQWQSGFNLETGPLYCIGYLYGYQDGRARIYFALHHLIVDTVSWRILVEDLKDLYNAQPLGIKGSSYRQWVRAVQDYANSHETERNYWSSIMTDYDGHKLETLATSSSSFDVHAHQEELTLTKEKTKTLLQKSNQAYQTDINDLLLAALACTLKDLTGDCINHICMEGHGREEINPHLDITKTSGWFTTIYPVRLETRDDIGRTIRVMKETLRTLPNKGIGYGALVGYSEGLNELPKVSFNYLGQFDGQDHASSSWKIVDEISGQALSPLNKNRAIIDINGLIIDGVLHFSIASALDDQKTKDFTQCFQSHLEHVIDHTAHLGRTYLTISDVGHIIEQEYLDQLQKDQEIVGVYLANSLQQGFIYHALNQGEWDDAYKIQLIWTYHHKLNEEKLQQAWQYAQARYPALRLRFSWDPDLVQVVDKKGMPLDWSFIDISDIKDAAQQALKIKQIQQEDRKKAYDLEKGPLFRIILIKEQDQRYTCLLSYNHAILDGWSNPVLLDYVHETYLKLLDKKPVNTQTDTSYGDTQKYLQENQNDHENYWDNYIEQIEERSDLSGLLSSGRKQLKLSDYKHIKQPKEDTLEIKDDLYYRLKNLSQKKGVTLNAILQYAWHKVLNIYSHSPQTVVGTTISGRNLPIDNIESSVGLYINTLPLIVNHRDQKNKSTVEIIKNIQDDINEMNSKSNVILAKLQKEGDRLFDSLFVYENYPNPINEDQKNKLKITIKCSIDKLDYPLVIIAHEENNQLMFRLNYASELFNKDCINDLLLLIKVLLEQISTYPDQDVASLSYLNTKQYHQIIETWNYTDKEYPIHKTIHQLFEEQVNKTPHNMAVMYEDQGFTYQQLNEKANQLAHYLRQIHDIEPDTLITLCLDRSEHLLIAILGVLKAGGAYVPIDPSYPDDRIRHILKDTNTKLVLTNRPHKKRLDRLANIKEVTQTNILAIDADETQLQLTIQSIKNPITATTSSNLSYVMYTSGTTGKPKGVMIDHIGCIVRILYMVNQNEISSKDVLLFKTNFIFDVSFSDIFCTLTAGAALCITKDIFNLDEIKSKLKTCNINICHFVPSQFYAIKQELDLNNYAPLNKLMFSGENLDVNALKYLAKTDKIILNYYGPTETGEVTLHKFNIYDLKSDLKEGCSIIGKPFHHTTVYVLDDNLTPLPIGAIGELYVGGIGLARGYLNSAESTAQKFIANPFQAEKIHDFARNSRLYKTGDLVRWLPDGNIEYIGRNDFQVKIRGHRIELGEIESVLSTFEGVKQCVVVAKNQESTNNKGHQYLVGYYVCDQPLNEDNIRNYLQSQLPDYMVPTILMWIASIPLTINGKLDRKALPNPELNNIDHYVAPQNTLEEKICDIWAEVLELPKNKIGMHDNFFRLGGNSILSIKILIKLNKELNVNVNLHEIIKNNTIYKFVNQCDSFKEICFNKNLISEYEEIDIS